MKDYGGEGAILADDMGLGKTLQTVALVYALLQRGSVGDGSPVKRVVVACPCSLVPNWKAEFDKWVNARAATKAERVDCRAVDGKVGEAIDAFLSPGRPFHVLLISYESLKLHVAKLSASATACDLLVCDEAQRLKGRKTQLSAALGSLRCARRILLTGTPVQNDLDEFFALADFANPGVLGTPDAFRKTFDAPIAKGLLRGAAPGDVKLAQDRQKILSLIAGRFLLRRENKLNAAHLPPKLVQVLVCRPAAPQRRAIAALLGEKRLQHALAGKQADVLAYIGRYKKICDHPSLDDDAGCDARARFSGERKSGKLHVLYRLLRELRGNGGQERVVVVANQTSSLELVSRLCSREGWPWCMLDGKTPLKQRKLLNDEFNDPACEHHFCFLLSSTAGGCGLNLIGGSRLVLFDSSWNPATDKQAAARCWRDGQKYQCYTYRFVSTGTLEERMLQRQLSKEGLQNVIEDKAQVNHFATDDLKKLFLFRPKTASDLHDELQCKACKGRAAARKDTSKAGGKNALSDGAADACLAFLENAVLAGDGHADARARLAAPVAVSADEASLHGAVERKRWNDAKPHMDLGSVKAKLAARGYGTIQQVLKDLRLVERCCRKLFDAGHATLNAAALMVRQVEDGWPGLVPQLYAANAAADETAAAADAVVCAPCDAPAEDGDGFKRQLYPLPKEEDLNNWSHHADLSTVQDEVLRRALRGQPQVSFVMGMYQDWDLIQQDTARQKEIEELEAKQKAEDLESARALAEAAAAEGDVCDGGDGGAPTTKKKKKKKKQDDAGEPSEAKAKKKRAPAAAADATPGGDSVASAAPSEAASAAPSEAASTPTAAPDGPRFPTAGQVIHVAWDKASTVDAAPNRCVVEAVGEPLPDKKRKGPEHLCFHAVARVKFLDVLDADGGFARVGAEDPRPRYVAEAFKLALAKYGTTWRVPDGATPMADVTNA
mmetsp:Transcript_11842/g.37863  ORF Transcript_11842/g.37863 Transcript_11842/m.37863 type:complete len:950 (+) Transcript_11842:370-3219(+)